jgi:hypothetical protein
MISSFRYQIDLKPKEHRQYEYSCVNVWGTLLFFEKKSLVYFTIKQDGRAEHGSYSCYEPRYGIYKILYFLTDSSKQISNFTWFDFSEEKKSIKLCDAGSILQDICLHQYE